MLYQYVTVVCSVQTKENMEEDKGFYTEEYGWDDLDDEL